MATNMGKPNTRKSTAQQQPTIPVAEDAASQPEEDAPSDSPPTEKWPELPQTLTQILTRLEEIGAEVAKLNGMDTKLQEIKESTDCAWKETVEEIKALKGITKSCVEEREQDRKELVRVTSQLDRATELNSRLAERVNVLENNSRICNIKIDGKPEEEGENLRMFVNNLVNFLCPGETGEGLITAVYRMGKRNVQGGRSGWFQRPRPVMITFTNVQARNMFYFARNKLKGSATYDKIYLNDDVNNETRKARDDYRSVAALARTMGSTVKIHSDGLVIDNRKYKHTEPESLPDKYSLERAKAVRINDEILFHSEHTCLSNFFPAPIYDNGINYHTAEHRYQAEKCRIANDNIRLNQVLRAISPLEAKKIADAIHDTPEWTNVKESVMEKVIDMKFEQHSYLADKLIATGDRTLKEATSNMYFGIGASLHSREVRDGTYKGQNRLGHILMAKRSEMVNKRAVTQKLLEAGIDRDTQAGEQL